MKKLHVILALAIFLVVGTNAFASGFDYRGAWESGSCFFTVIPNGNTVTVKTESDCYVRSGKVTIISKNKIKVANGNDWDNVLILKRTNKHKGEIIGTTTGLSAGATTGAIIGSHIGIAAGPLGAFAGTIPGAIIGGIIGGLTGNKIGSEIDK